MKRVAAVVLLSTICSFHAARAQDGSMNLCLPPEEPFPYRLSRSDPLYDTARGEHQAYLEGMEDYIRCLDGERDFALKQLRISFRQFMHYFGKDAVFHYPARKVERK